MNIRDALHSDLASIVEIYNSAVTEQMTTPDTESVTLKSQMAWFDSHNPRQRPLWVLDHHHEVVGWVSLQNFRGGQRVFRQTAEISVYVAPHLQHRGYGTMLTWRMVEHCPSLKVGNLLAMYFDHNEGARRLFNKVGFREFTRLSDVAEIRGLSRGMYIAGYSLPKDDS